MTDLSVTNTPKMLRETLCVAQNLILSSALAPGRREVHAAALQQLIDECDRHRPLGIDGKHGDLHTETCGCEDR